MTTTITIANPILHGMHPDPSWIWDDDLRQIVLVTSTFELVPGLPIYVSRDMAHWKHVSDAIDEELARRLLIPFVDDSGGVYAPTLRRIRGKYVIACTIARINGRKAIAEGCSQAELDAAQAAEGNFVLESDSIDGPWRGPFWIEGAEGIDPDIFEDGDGNVYWTQTRPAVNPQWEGQTEVWTQRIDPETWTFVDDGLPAGSGKTVIWRGYGVESVWAEAPHLYRVGDYVYLMTAEGGTSFEHSEMAMRIYAPHGLLRAFEAYEREASESGECIPQVRDGERCYLGTAIRAFHADKKNPILTHRHLGLSEPLQCVGHADLLLHPELGWWLVCLGVRETRGKHDGELLSYLGRESFVAPVSWEHNPADWKLDGNGALDTHEGDPGWPVTCAGLGRLADEITVTTEDDGITIEPRVKSSLAGDVEPALVDVADGSTNGVVVRDERDEFESDELGLNWNTLRVPFTDAMGTVGGGKLALRGQGSLCNLFDLSLVARRWQAFDFDAETKVRFDPKNYMQMAGLTNYYDDLCWSWAFVTWDEKRHARVIEVAQNDFNQYTSFLKDDAIVVPEEAEAVWLRTKVRTEYYSYEYSFDGEHFTEIPVRLDAKILSDDYVNQRYGGFFTGAFVGLACVDLSGYDAKAEFDYFDYRELPDNR